MNIKENSIIILEDNIKAKFLSTFRKDRPLFNIKVLGLNEFKKKYFFDYTTEAIYYIHKKYNVIKSVAEIYLQNLYYLNVIDDEKVKFLNTIKKDLEQNNLLIKDKQFKNSLHNQNIVLYNLNYLDKFYESIFESLEESNHIERIEEIPTDGNRKKLYKLPNKETEVEFVASLIANLIKNGTDINKIKLANFNDDYSFTLYKTFKDFNIPLELPNNETVESSIVIHKFKELISDNIEHTFNELKKFVKSTRDRDIYKCIIDCLNNYSWAENYIEVKDFIFEDLNKIKKPATHLKNAIQIIDFPDYTPNDAEHIFLINFNQGVIPICKKDEEYLNDETKIKLGLSNSVDLNKKATKKLQNAIYYTKNLIVTYREQDLGGELYISNAYREELFEPEDYWIDFTSSNAYNKKFLLHEKDENRKYGTRTEELLILNNHYKDEEYLSYNNKFTRINKNKLNKLLDSKLTLSYSSMDTYYKCAFRYYLDNILRVNKFEDTFETTIGNIFHNILSIAFKPDFNFDSSWNETIEKCEYEFNTSEKFFLSILKPELEFIINTINTFNDYTSLKNALYEQRIEIKIDESRNILFKGFVDKILYDETPLGKIAAIIDYKTGNPQLSLDNCFYGLDMQLPIYAFLIKNYESLRDARLGGFYLQKILNNKKVPEEKIDSLKLQGYSNADLEVLNLVDNTYANSKLIKSMKTTSNGLSSYAKVLTDREIDELTELVYKKIREASDSILDGNFEINPKEIDGVQHGCKFCKYKDICYMNNKDIVKLKKIKQEEFLGGEAHANVD